MRRAGGWVLGLLVLAVMAGGAWALLRRVVPSETITIVSILPRGGPGEERSEALVNGIALALDERNFRAAQFRVKHKDLDSRSEEARPGTVVKDLSAVAVIGGLDRRQASEISPKLQQAKLLFVSPTCSDLRPQDPGDLRMVARDYLQGVGAVQWARRMEVESAFLVDDDPLDATGITHSFRWWAQSTGLRIVGDEKYFWLYADDAALVHRIVREKPPLVYLAGLDLPSAARFVSRLRGARYGGRIMMSQRGLNPDFMERAGAAAEGVLFTSVLLPPPAEFDREYRARHGEPAPREAWTGYRAAKAVLDAVERARTKDRAAIRAACAALPLFDARGDPARPVLGAYAVRGGRFEFVEELRP